MKRNLVELLAVSVLCIVAGLVFKSAFVSWGFAPTIVSAAVLSTGGSVLVHNLGGSLGRSALLSLVGYLAFGMIVIFGAPSTTAFSDMIDHSIDGWRRLLTIAAPADPLNELRVVPFASAWVGSFIAAEATLRTRSLAAPLVGPSLIVVLAALFGLSASTSAAVLGLVLLACTLVVIELRLDDSWVWRSSFDDAYAARRGAAAVVLLGLAAMGALLVTPRLPAIPDDDRVTLRDVVSTPFEIRSLRTPLVDFKSSLDSSSEDVAALTVRGPNLAGQRIRVAVLDEYDGVTWTSASALADDGLQRVGQRFPGLIEGTRGTGLGAREYEITLQAHEGNWLPTMGLTEAVSWGSGTEELLGNDPFARLRIDPKNGNLLVDVPIGPPYGREGLTYVVSSLPATTSPDLEGARLSPQAEPVRSEFTSSFAALANEIVGQEADSVQQLRRIESALRDPSSGPVSSAGSGKNPTYDTEAPPGHAVYRVFDTLFGDSDEYRGTAEQYSTAFALLASSLEIPSRVVVGYEIDNLMVGASAEGNEIATVRKSDLTAWVEVPFIEHGWVQFEAGPLESATPIGTPTAGGGQSSLDTVPPPPPIDDVVDQDEDLDLDEEADCEGEECDAQDEASSLPTGLIYAAAGIGLPALALVAAIAIVLGLKRRRRRRRRSGEEGDGVAGAWCELLDIQRDAGVELGSGLTLREQVVELRERPGSQAIAQLSQVVEHSAFSGERLRTTTVDTAWEYLAAVEAELAESSSARELVALKLNVRSLRRPANVR